VLVRSTIIGMRAVGWHNGGPPTEPSGYGLKVTPAERDRAFDKTWDEVVVDLDGGEEMRVALTPSFWRRCSELRSAEIGRWLLGQGAAPWPKSSPPGIALRQVEGNRFTARVLKRPDPL